MLFGIDFPDWVHSTVFWSQIVAEVYLVMRIARKSIKDRLPISEYIPELVALVIVTLTIFSHLVENGQTKYDHSVLDEKARIPPRIKLNSYTTRMDGCDDNHFCFVSCVSSIGGDVYLSTWNGFSPRPKVLVAIGEQYCFTPVSISADQSSYFWKAFSDKGVLVRYELQNAFFSERIGAVATSQALLHLKWDSENREFLIDEKSGWH